MSFSHCNRMGEFIFFSFFFFVTGFFKVYNKSMVLHKTKKQK